MSFGPLVSYRAGTWVIDECQIAFFMSCLLLRNLDPLCLSLFSMSFVLPSTICLLSWIPRIPVLCSPAYHPQPQLLHLSHHPWHLLIPPTTKKHPLAINMLPPNSLWPISSCITIIPGGDGWIEITRIKDCLMELSSAIIQSYFLITFQKHCMN